MVQATPRNIQEIKRTLDNFITAEIANFTAGFIEGFEILRSASNFDYLLNIIIIFIICTGF